MNNYPVVVVEVKVIISWDFIFTNYLYDLILKTLSFSLVLNMSPSLACPSNRTTLN